MATGYTRNDTSNNISNGSIIDAADLDGEFDAIQAAMDATTGHTHDGTVGGGAPILNLGPAQDVIISTSVVRPKTDNTVDLGTSSVEFKNLYLDGTAKVDTLVVDESANIAGGLTVDTTTLVVDATNNRVGVGTASPSTSLHISSATPIITLTDTDNPHSATINTNSTTGSLSISADTGNTVADSAIILNIDNDEKVRVLADGSVGIGTATPSAKLDVVGSAEINGDLTVTGNTTLGNAATDTVTFTADVASNLLPSADNTYDLGASGSQWKDLYIDGTANIDALVADAATIVTSSGGTLTLQRDDTSVTSGETLGEVDFQAPNVSGGGDAILVAAKIKAVAGDTFDAAVNKTSLLFQTASSGAVATRMEIDGDGNVAVDTNTLYVDAANNRVGINNASPSVALDVTGTITSDGLTVDTNTLYVDATNNRVGIGTSSPATLFHVAANNSGLTGTTANNTIRLEDTDTTSGTDQPIGKIEFYSNDTNAPAGVKAYILASATNTQPGSYLAFATSGTASGDVERVRIDSAGNVGIGTSSPLSSLHVEGGNGIRVSDSFPEINLYDTDVSGLYHAITGSGSTSLRFNADAGNVSANTTLEFLVDNTERMRIDSSGNVGIGTSSPGVALDVVGTGSVAIEVTGTTSAVLRAVSDTTGTATLALGDTDDIFRGGLVYDNTTDSLAVHANNDARMTILSSGDVGIGTDAPSYDLDISKSATTEVAVRIKNTNTAGTDPDANLYLDSGNINGEANIEFMKGGTSYGRLTALQSDMRLVSDTGDIEFSTGGSVSATITSSGSVGINTTDPASATKLHVVGGFLIEDIDDTASAGPTFYIRRTSASPADDDYLGEIRFQGTNSIGENNINYARIIAQATDVTSGTEDGALTFWTTENGTPSMKMELRNNGNLNLNGGGTTAGGFSFGTVGDVAQYRSNNTASTGAYNIYSNWGDTNRNVFRIRTDGNVLNYNNSYGALSDAKLKENVADATPKLEDLCKLRVVNFNYIGDENKQLGLIAQEVEQVFPKLVDENPDTDADGNETGEVTKSVKYSILVPMLVKAIQEQQDMISALEARLTALESK